MARIRALGPISFGEAVAMSFSPQNKCSHMGLSDSGQALHFGTAIK